MNCKCIEDIEQKLVGQEFGRKKAKVLKATIPTGLLFGQNKLVAITASDIELVIEGYKKPQKQSIVHSFCPFCGIKTDKGESEE